MPNTIRRCYALNGECSTAARRFATMLGRSKGERSSADSFGPYVSHETTGIKSRTMYRKVPHETKGEGGGRRKTVLN